MKPDSQGLSTQTVFEVLFHGMTTNNMHGQSIRKYKGINRVNGPLERKCTTVKCQG
jgi:hypothetical protein